MTERAASLAAGHRLGDDEVERVLDLCPTTITYYALHVDSGRPVALQEYFPRDCAMRVERAEVWPATLELAARFKQGRDVFRANARAAAGIRHPGLVDTEDYFVTNNTVYVITGFVAGSTLLDLLEHQGRLNEEQVYRLFTDVLPALAEVHSQGALYLNVTPRNLIRRPDGRWLLNGIAAGAMNRPRGYAAPERYSRDRAKLGAWTDLYAFGMTAYRCISGIEETTLPDAPARARAGNGNRNGTALTSAVQIGKRRYAHKVLQAIDRAIDLEPNERPASARELLASVAVAQTRSRGTGTPRRHARPLLALVLFLLGLSALGVWYYERAAALATGIAVHANVGDAQVFLDGASAGRAGPGAPLVVEGIDPGAHRLRVRRTGYRPFAATVVVDKGQRHEVKVLLDPQSVTLAIEANVDGYVVYLDDRPIQAAAPGRYTFPVGERRLRVEKPGYVPHEQTLSLHADAASALRIVLDPECRQVARVEQRCREQPLQRFREQMVVERKVMRRRGYGEQRALGEPLFAEAQPAEVQDAACANARKSAESRLLENCALEPRDGEYFLADVDYDPCDCDAQRVRDIYGRQALATVQCRVAARAVCATEVRRAVRYTDANQQCEDVLVQETLCN